MTWIEITAPSSEFFEIAQSQAKGWLGEEATPQDIEELSLAIMIKWEAEGLEGIRHEKIPGLPGLPGGRPLSAK